MELLNEVPWCLAMPACQKQEWIASETAHVRSQSDTWELAVVDDDQNGIVNISAALREGRSTLGLGAAAAHDDFTVMLLGGPHAVRRNGAVFEFLRTTASGSSDLDWFRARNMNLAFQYQFFQYGEVVAGILARAWCHRIRCLFKLALLTEKRVKKNEW